LCPALDCGVAANAGTEAADTEEEIDMLRWAVIFFIVALIAAVLGFSGIALASAGIAKILFYIFLVLFLVSLLSHAFRGRSV